jgi:CTP:molybdopterin cytidylyltransferase MocA
VRPSLVPRGQEAHGAPMRRLMRAGVVRDVPAVDGEADDVDTWSDLARLRGRGSPGSAHPRRT